MVPMKFLIAHAVIVAGVATPAIAAASQGPGAGPGTAGHLMQTAMAIVIYGGCGLIVAAGLIGAVKDVRK